jgi:hypothetical protein
MEVVRIATVEEFLAVTEAYRLGEPTRTNVVSSVAMAVARGIRRYDAYFWWAVLDEGECVGAAFRTVPFALHIGPMPAEAVPPLAHAVAAHDDAFSRIVGSEEAVASFLATYATCGSSGSRRHFDRGTKSLLYELGELAMPRVQGSHRVATLDDIELVAQWTRDFQEFTGTTRLPEEREREALVARLRENSLRLWVTATRRSPWPAAPQLPTRPRVQSR